MDTKKVLRLAIFMSKRLNNTLANCRDIETDFFYMSEADLQDAGTSLRFVRRLCFDCPIQKECAEYGFQYEKYGTFGGFTDRERMLIMAKQWHHNDLKRMFEQLAHLGVRWSTVFEYADIQPTHIAPADWMKEGA